MSKQRDFKGVWIPKEIYLATDLSWSEKILLIEIDSLDNDEEKGCYAGSKHFADFLGLKSASVRNMLVRLKEKGYVVELWSDGKNRGLATSFRQHKRHKKMAVKCHKKMRDVSQKSDSDVSQKSDHSNTDKETNNTKIETGANNAPVNIKPSSLFASMFDVAVSPLAEDTIDQTVSDSEHWKSFLTALALQHRNKNQLYRNAMQKWILAAYSKHQESEKSAAPRRPTYENGKPVFGKDDPRNPLSGAFVF